MAFCSAFSMLLDDPSEYAKNLKIGGQITKINDCEKPDNKVVNLCTLSFSMDRALLQSPGSKTMLLIRFTGKV